MKNNKKRFLTSVIAIICIICMTFTAMAAYSNINAETTRIASIATNNGCDAAEGLTVTASGNNKRLFVAKVNDDDSLARLFMYEDYTNMVNGNNTYGVFTLSGFAGHANGMAIDDNYIYITCWENNANGTNGNKIVRISRSMLWNKYQSTTATNKGTLYSNSSGVTILTAKKDTGSNHNKFIKTITYYKDGKFIINYPLHTDGDAGESRTGIFTFTTATISGGNFIVSTNDSDIFQVDSGIQNTMQQDIGYDPSCGFFIPRWYEGTNNNVIIWIKLNSRTGTNRVYTPNNSKFRIINVNGSAINYTSYEIESVSIGSDDCMYASVNTRIPSRGSDANYGMDAVIRIERPTAVGGSKNFLGIYFGQ